MQWLFSNFDRVMELTWNHVVQSVVPLILATIIAVPLAQLARQNRVIKGISLGLSSFLFTLPSIALFIFLPLVLGTSIIDPINVIVALTIYAVSLLLRSGIDALESVDESVRQAAVALGYTPLRRFWTVDLPLSLPVLFAGLRVISVTNISLVSVAIVIGVQNLGYFFSDGLRRGFITEIVIGIVFTLILALIMDAILVLIQRLLTPWDRATARTRTKTRKVTETAQIEAVAAS
ncbi:ABC transporter permease [Haematomicrobium sanguinis]|uniref:ABC transporter permease n=1 Tax=Haematomicrobium sanguinis TaxID=479106 RepID=UPI00068F1150|nr:ABC transporter permease [Haematomicrobium sanguinis]